MKGNGVIPLRDVQKALVANGFRLDRNNGHFIYVNDKTKKVVALPRKCNQRIVQRIYKENNIV